MAKGAQVLILAVTALLASAGLSGAAEVLAPLDGDTVTSRPSFIVDYQQGTLEVEFARTPDLLTAGPNVGGFVEPERTDFMLVGLAGRRPGIADWSTRRLPSGLYYWHAKAADYAAEDEAGPWGPTRSLTVANEPPVVEGWTLRARRVSRRACGPRSRYRYAYRLDGTIRWADNEDAPRGRYTLSLRHVSGKSVRFTGGLDSTSRTYAHLLCTNVSRARATLRVTDSSGQVTVAASKQARFGG